MQVYVYHIAYFLVFCSVSFPFRFPFPRFSNTQTTESESRFKVDQHSVLNGLNHEDSSIKW